jgi:hypothetical protein
MKRLAPPFYSPKYVEVKFCELPLVGFYELRRDGVLGSCTKNSFRIHRHLFS